MRRGIPRRAALVLLCALLPALGGCRREPASADASVFAMDTVMDLAVYGDREDACRDALSAAVETLYRLDGELDAASEDSELFRLNHADGAPTELSGETGELLDGALALCRATDGALDITAYPAVQAWGFPSGEYRVPSREELAELAKRIDYTAVDREGTLCRLPAGMELDLGAVAKGYAADQLEEQLTRSGVSSAMLDLGQSTICALGERPGGGKWRIGLQDPAGEGYLAVVELSGHMSTSGGYQRYFEQDGAVYWHILDPATAAPARSGLSSASVIGEEGLLCDGLSTALFVLGPERGAQFWRENRNLGFEAVLLLEDGSIQITPGLEDSFSLAEGYEDRDVTILRP